MEKFPPGESSGEKPLDSRESKPTKEILLLVDGEEKIFDASEVFEQYNVSNWVRIPSAEFDAIDTEKPFVARFNFGNPNHVVGERYLVMRLLRNGVRASGTQKEQPPLLSLDGAFIAECVEIEHNIPYGALTEKYFAHSVKGISDSASLKAAIQKNYRASRPDLTSDQIASRGVAYTLFKIIKRVGR